MKLKEILQERKVNDQLATVVRDFMSSGEKGKKKVQKSSVESDGDTITVSYRNNPIVKVSTDGKEFKISNGGYPSNTTANYIRELATSLGYGDLAKKIAFKRNEKKVIFKLNNKEYGEIEKDFININDQEDKVRVELELFTF